MKLPLIRPTGSVTTLIVLLIITLSFFSCQKEFSVDNGIISGTPPDLSTKIASSVSGFVTDENDAPVTGSTVQFGTATSSTDKYGFFEFKNVQVVQNAATVTVNRPGYFKGIKTYLAKAGKSAFFRIKLIPKKIAGTINGSGGGSVTTPAGLSIALPANAVFNTRTQTPYTGMVNVAAYYIDPAAADINMIMPGDLRGINTDGILKLLRNYGMAAVELTGASGELLQIAPGKKATLTIPISNSSLPNAPSSIALWYFDETIGLWKQEGNAIKTGNTYVGEVSHFSFWDPGLPGNYVQFDCTVLDVNNNPVQNTLVEVGIASNPYPANYRFENTDNNGFVSGFVPDNQQLFFKIYEPNCQLLIYTQFFTTAGTSVSLGNVNIVDDIAHVSGTMTTCNNSPVTNGYLMMRKGGVYYRYNLTNTGSFSFDIPICANSNTTFIGEDNTSMQQSNIIPHNLTVGNNVIGNIFTCGTSNQEFFNYSINGTNYSFTPPVAYFGQQDGSNANNIPTEFIYATDYITTGELVFTQQNIAPGSTQTLENFYCSQAGTDSSLANSSVPVYITEYGAVGQFIAGNFSGILTGTPSNLTYAITCNFRVRRYY